MEYNFRDIEQKWQQWWKENKVYKVSNDSPKPKCYVLDMFPYPSGAGLHVGHPLGYIASDIYARYKRLKGFNVLHPMGYDAFGLPAEQYAIEHGIHPAVSTEANIKNFRSQLDKIGFCYDWDREVNTSKPEYYKWTQWLFLKLYNSYFCNTAKKAKPIAELIAKYETKGSSKFTAEQWNNFSVAEKEEWLMKRRLAYSAYGEVNWCEALGTVLANDEVINGVSERGGHPVEKRKMRQWYLRITAYADRLLEGLNTVDFSDAMKEMQINWIGKSSGAEIDFAIRRGSASPQPSPPGEGEAEGAPKTKFFKTADNINWNILKEYGRINRKNPTEAESILWQRFRNNQLGAKVRRQHTIQGYIADFAFLEVRLVIEVDGGYHNAEEQKVYDEARTKFLTDNGLDVLRFTNDEVIKNTNAVVEKVKKAIDERKIKLAESSKQAESVHPSPSGEGKGEGEATLTVYTTRPDTIFGVDFMVIAPELELVNEIKSAEQTAAVDEYLAYVKSRSERERMAEKKITGVFTGAYAIHPFSGREIPIWTSEYVLAGYGTGAIMAVPCGDERDHKFARHFNIPITNIIGSHYNGEEANPTKDAILENSGFLNGMLMKDAIEVAINKMEEVGIGKRKVNYKMRDAGFSRQRYWGEPFPITWKEGVPFALDESQLPLILPHMEEIKAGKNGEGPLSNNEEWLTSSIFGGGRGEASTMPGYAGSSWYFLRYMDPDNKDEFCSRLASDYWGQVDVYIGGTEHAVGHLLYSRMWTKVLYDLGLVGHDEPFKRLLNQGMIQGSSRFVYRIHGSNKFVSVGLKEQYEVDAMHVDVNIVDGLELDIAEFRKWRNGEYADAVFICEDGSVSLPGGEGQGGAYICGVETEKMSKSKFNTVNPDDLVYKYGADTFRMYEMFLGPVEMSKPWDTKGIEGVHRFLKKLWRLFFDEMKGPIWTTTAPSPQGEGRGEAPTDAELKILHKTIKKIEEDTERFSFNTAVSTFMICVNELTDLKCHKKEILEPLLILLSPYAPHIAEELYHQLGSSKTPPSEGHGEAASILDATFPKWEEKYIKETSKAYPVAINGKTRSELTIALDATEEQVHQLVLQDAMVQKWLEGKAPKKIIFVKNKMINVVI
jgi:leucyl-tRNA synthetase